MENNVILVDYDTNSDWQYLSGLNSSKLKWIVEHYPSNTLSQKKRWKYYFKIGFILFKKRNTYHRVVAIQQFYGLLFAFFLRFFRIKKGPQITVTEFIYIKKKGLFGKLYHWLFKTALNYNNLDLIICLSSHEVIYYSQLFPKAKNKFQFLKIGTHNERYWPTNKGDYYLSAGSSNRDYQFLVDSFKAMPEKKLLIVCNSLNIVTPKNVTIIRNCFDKDYEKLLANCFATVLSLDDSNPVSCGQLVVCRSFAYHKPVIVTSHPGINDYVLNGINGFIISKKLDSLKQSMNELDNPTKYAVLSNAKENEYYEYDYARKIELLIEKTQP